MIATAVGETPHRSPEEASSAPGSPSYGPGELAKDLIAIALGDTYSGSALYAARGMLILTEEERDCIQRWLDGTQGNTDHIELQHIANKISGRCQATEEATGIWAIQKDVIAALGLAGYPIVDMQISMSQYKLRIEMVAEIIDSSADLIRRRARMLAAASAGPAHQSSPAVVQS